MLRGIFTPLLLSGLLLAGCDTTPAQSPLPSRAVPLDRDPSASPVSGPGLDYPVTLLVQRREGVVTVECTVLVSGATGCSVVAGSDEREFRQAALECVEHSIYAPANRNGVAADQIRRWTLVFGLVPVPPDVHDESLPAGAVPPRAVAGRWLIYPARMQRSGREGIVDVECTVGVDGRTRDCRATNGAGGDLFLYAALDHARWSRFAPALLNGAPIEAKQRLTVKFRLNPPGPVAPTLPTQAQPINLPISLVPLESSFFRWRTDRDNPARDGAAQVTCLVTIESTTKDCSIRESSGNAENDAAVLRLVSSLQFGPALHDGVPVETRGVWSVSFDPTSATIGSTKTEATK